MLHECSHTRYESTSSINCWNQVYCHCVIRSPNNKKYIFGDDHIKKGDLSLEEIRFLMNLVQGNNSETLPKKVEKSVTFSTETKKCQQRMEMAKIV